MLAIVTPISFGRGQCPACLLGNGATAQRFCDTVRYVDVCAATRRCCTACSGTGRHGMQQSLPCVPQVFIFLFHLPNPNFKHSMRIAAALSTHVRAHRHPHPPSFAAFLLLVGCCCVLWPVLLLWTERVHQGREQIHRTEA